MRNLTLGVEEELHVVELATGCLVPRAPELMEAVRPRLRERVTSELNLCQIEVVSPICRTLDEALEHVLEARGALLDAAAPLGLGVIAGGTHPTGRWQDQQVDRSRPRFRALEETYQRLAREQIICGCHVHVGVEPDRRADVLRAVRPWLPTLLALTASSPCWQGKDTGYASFRYEVWRRWPTAGPPPAFADMDAYHDLVQDLVDAGAVADASYLYWDARPSVAHPTVEVRSLDTCLDPRDGVAVAGLVRGLAWTALAGRADAWSQAAGDHRLDAAMWRAARYGLDGALLGPDGPPRPATEVVEDLLAAAGPGLRAHGDEAAVRDQVGRILDRGNGATAQRRLLAGTDADAAPLELVRCTRDGLGELEPVASRGVA